MKAVLCALAIFIVALGCGYYRFHATNLLVERSPTLPPDSQEIKEKNIQISKISTKPSIYSVSKRIHIALGYGFSNTILLLGDDGYVIIDSSRSEESAQTVKKDFESLTKGLPLKAVICSLNYNENCFGSKVFTEGHSEVQIWGRKLKKGLTRQYREFDEELSETPNLRVHVDHELPIPSAANIFSGTSMDLSVAGLSLRLMHVPGQIEDQTVVWYAEEKALLSADVFDTQFQHHFAIRGTPARDTLKWIQGLDAVRALRSEILLPSHSRPLFGAEYILNTLTIYRDALQSIHDQTIQKLNENYSIDDIAERIYLPARVRNNEFMKELVATIPWFVRDVATFYVGFFNGVPVDLFPLSPAENAKEFIDLGGGFEAALQKAMAAYDDNRLQWAFELTSNLRELEPNNPTVRDLYLNIVRAKVNTEPSNNGKHFYSTYLKSIETQ